MHEFTLLICTYLPPTWKINYAYMQHSEKYVNIQDSLLRLHATKLFRKSIWYWKINLIMTVSDITLARSNILWVSHVRVNFVLMHGIKKVHKNNPQSYIHISLALITFKMLVHIITSNILRHIWTLWNSNGRSMQLFESTNLEKCNLSSPYKIWLSLSTIKASRMLFFRYF